MAPRVIIIGSGIVGSSLADELALRGYTNITVVDQGPLFITGGSTSHAPGLVFQTNSSKAMSDMAQYTVKKFLSLSEGKDRCFSQVGGLEIAVSEQRLTELHRKLGWAHSWGIEGRIIDSDECCELFPLLDPSLVIGGFYTPQDGLANALKAVECQAKRAMSVGVQFYGDQKVTQINHHGGKITGVTVEGGEFYAADIVICCAGFWGAQLGKSVGMSVPLLPMAHQYVHTTAIPEIGDFTMPILRHQDHDLYYRQYRDYLGIGTYFHRPMPVGLSDIQLDQKQPAMMAFTLEDFLASWKETRRILPVTCQLDIAEGFNGVFSFTPDGGPLIGSHPYIENLWIAEAIWVTHSAGAAKALAEWIITGSSSIDLHAADVNRFDQAQFSPQFVQELSSQNFVEVYDIIHPHQYREQLRGLRTSPFFEEQKKLGAFFYESSGWERPGWFDHNKDLLLQYPQIVDREGWEGRYYSSIGIAEALAAREHVGIFDMTPLTRCIVEGPGAMEFLQSLSTNNLNKPVGSVTYTLLLDHTGGIKSDITIARLAAERFQLGINGPRDIGWLRLHAPQGLYIHDSTNFSCCLGVWGPYARMLLTPLCTTSLENKDFRYFSCQETFIGPIPVTMLRVSYIGELGWEIYTDAAYGRYLWHIIWEQGQSCNAIAAGRIAFNSLRIEKGYRLYGTDMSTEHSPSEAGLDFAVKSSENYLGKNSTRISSRTLATLIFDAPDAVVLGKEPVFLTGKAIGYITSAAYSPHIGTYLAYAWLPAEITANSIVHVKYFDRTYTALVAFGPQYDPSMSKILI